jgi:MraZ protein
MFEGGAQLMLDAKGRMTIPAAHRDALVAHGEKAITLTRHPRGQLLLYPKTVWDSKRREVENWPVEAEDWKRIVLGMATTNELDATGRIVIAPVLRTWARLEKDVTVTAMGNYLEIWDTATVQALDRRTVEGGMPASIATTFRF